MIENPPYRVVDAGGTIGGPTTGGDLMNVKAALRPMLGRLPNPHRTSTLTTPSFLYKINERRRMSVVDPVVLGAGVDKEATRRFAQEHDIPVPAIFHEADSIHAVDWGALPATYVIKPTDAYNSRGVFLIADGRSLLDGSPVEPAAITAELERFSGSGFSGAVMIEELIGDGDRAPDDWKFYAFNGAVELVLQKRMNGSRHPADWRYKWWDGDFNHVGPIRWGHQYDAALPHPRHPDELRKLAARVSTLLRMPFARIDLFDTDRVVMGEITPRPGSAQVFPPAIDEQLGRAWEAAEVALLSNHGC